jgi:hypothetical protein
LPHDFFEESFSWADQAFRAYIQTMNNSQDRVRRLDVAAAQSPTLGPPVPASVPGRPRARAAPPASWSAVVDGWVRDPAIRRDALIALVLVLIAAVAAICAVTGALGPLVREATGNTVVRLVAGSVLGGGGLAYGGLRLRRRRTRRAEQAAALTPGQNQQGTP